MAASERRATPAAATKNVGRGRSVVSVAVIGGGRLGAALAAALARTDGHRVLAVVTRHAAPKIALPAKIKTLTLDNFDALPPSDLYLIATPDDQIQRAAESLARLLHARPSIALHTSGALSSDELEVLRAAGFAVGSLHPLLSVSDAAQGARTLLAGGVAFCVEGDARAVRAARAVTRALGGRSFAVRPGTKALYHAAAVTAAGHLVALVDAGVAMLGACGLGERRARALLLPLAASALGNLATQTAARALTGPYARADRDTVRRHVAALEVLGDENARAIYFALARRQLALAAASGADRRALREIESLIRRAHRQ